MRNISLAAAVGVLTGAAAIVFQLLTEAVHVYGMEFFSGYVETGPSGESGSMLMFPLGERPFRPWMLLPLMAGVGLIVGLLCYFIAPEAAGGGTDTVINAYHNQRGKLRLRASLVKMVVTPLTVGAGGSGGREGPIAQIGGGFGSAVATRLKLNDAERRNLMAAGIGSGIGAIFHAPLAGSIFAIEVLYRDPDFETENLIPAFIATTLAYSVYCLVFGFDRLFTVEPIVFHDPRLLLPFTVLAVAMAGGALLYARSLRTAKAVFQRVKLHPVLRPVVGMSATAAVAMLIFHLMAGLGESVQRESLSVLSVGYGFIQRLLMGELPGSSTTLVTLLLVVGLGKILTTALTIGSGGAAGVFGPSVVIGGSLGAVVGMVMQMIMPGVVTRIDLFALLGMAAFFSAAANTPMSTLLMVSEITGNYELLLPSMWVCALAYLVGRNWTVYESQVPSRIHSPAHRGDFIVDVLQGLTVRDALPKARTDFVTVPADMPLQAINQLVTDTRQICFPVVDGEGRYFGLFSLNDMRQFLYQSDLALLAVAQDLANTAARPLATTMKLSDAIGSFTTSPYEEMPIVDDAQPDKVIALLRRGDMIATYSRQLMSLRQDGEAA